ncbi:MAG: hypothetical protein KDC98_05670, partial [Planctomycetes bacterium]|nr:hypothetical protein [Planctomycetota bacterium]
STIAAIAGEKAAVVRPGGTGFTAARGVALDVIRAHAERVGARLYALGEDFGPRDPVFGEGGCRFRLQLPNGAERAVQLPDARGFEVPALCLAIAVLDELMPDAPLALEPAPRPRLPGRFEILADRDGAVLVLDGAHTEDSLTAVATELRRRWPGQRPALLYATAAGKRWQQGLSVLLQDVDSVVVTGLLGTASEDPAAIARWIASRGVASEAVADAGSGLAALRRRPGPRVVVGSFYLVGQVRGLVMADLATDIRDEST